VPFVICAPPPPRKPKQQALDAKEKLHEEDIFILQIRRKKGKKIVRGVVIRKSA